MKDKIKLAVAQYPVTQHADFQAWKTYVEKWISDAVASKADLLIFPEYGSIELTSFASDEVKKNLQLQIKYLTELNQSFIETFKELAQKYSTFIIAPTIPVYLSEKQKTVNRCYFFSKSGQFVFQDKLFMTRFEEEEWRIASSESIQGEYIQKVFETEVGHISISTCFDVEFSEPALTAAKAGCQLLIAPSCTETIQGCSRVHIGARARALENQFYVLVSQTIGDANWSLATDKNTGYAAIYGPPDLGFSEDGILAKGIINQPGWLFSEIFFSKINQARTHGSVFNFKKHQDISGLGRIKFQKDVLR